MSKLTPGTFYVYFWDYDEGRANGNPNPDPKVIASDFPDAASANAWMEKEESDPKYKDRWVSFNVRYEYTDDEVKHYRAVTNIKHELDKNWREVLILIQQGSDDRAKELLNKIADYIKDLRLDA